ncbi:ATP-binding protein [Amycolatopsis pithecellobii]|uniref:ATP-binding protein n=1 Tax=Amycolatopsis pithecellobii TaxID=664692 RepID=UPI00140E6FBC|nr:AAA family ATPase [Amycolatopsis pithecellobii]
MRLPLVARSGAVAEIRAAVERARAGRGGLVLVTGDAGVGKTRLAEEASAAADGLRVLWTWCTPGAALRPWARVVRTLAAERETGEIVRRSTSLAGLAGLATSPESRDPETARWWLSLDLTDLLRAAAPVLVIVDDLQDADLSSLRLLTEIAPALRSAPVLVLATARDDEAEWRGREEVRATLNRLGARVRLHPFADAEVAELAAATGAAPAVVRTISRRTGGNPLLVCELLASGADPDSVVPSSVQALVAARLAGLPEPARAVVTRAAVLGSRFRLDVLAELAGVSLSDVGERMDEAAGVVERVEPGIGRFRHELIRDAVYDVLAPGELAGRHRVAADCLIRRAGRGFDVDAAEIAAHLLRAGAPEGADWATRAGQEALRRLAFEDAAAWYAEAGRCLEAAGAPWEERARNGIALGEALTASGARPRARACLLEAADRAERAGRMDLVAEAVLGIGAGRAGFEIGLLDQRQIDLLERLREEPLPDVLRALVTARLSVALTFVGSPQRRLELATDAVTEARASGDDVAVAAALAASCDAMAGPEHCHERLAAATEIVEVAQRIRDPRLVLLGRRLRLVALLEIGRIGDADAEITAYRVVAETVGHPLYTWYVPLWRGMRALMQRRFDDCRASLAEAAALGERAGSDNAAVLVSTQRWLLCAESGDREGLRGMLAELDQAALPGAWPHITRALLLAQLGRVPEARDQLDAVAPLLPGMVRDSEWLPAMAQLAETLAVTGPRAVTRWVRDALTPYAGLYAVEGIGAAVRGPVRQFLDQLDGQKPLTDNEFRRDGEYWTVRWSGVESRLRDSKGLRDLGALLAAPGRPVAALDLAGVVVESDTGPMLDTHARTAYQRRLRELETEADDADATGDAGRAAKIGAEREALLAELTRAYGLGGRDRRAGSSAERARTAVTARISYAIRRIAGTDRALAEHLRRCVRTGTFCVYDPESPVDWRT